MSENQLMHGLKRRYGEILGALDLFDNHVEDLAHLSAVIRMFDPSADVSTIKPIRRYRRKRVKWLHTALKIMREANAPMTARDIAHRVLAARGEPPTNANLQRVECSMHAALARLEGRGIVRLEGTPKRWSAG